MRFKSGPDVILSNLDVLSDEVECFDDLAGEDYFKGVGEDFRVSKISPGLSGRVLPVLLSSR